MIPKYITDLIKELNECKRITEFYESDRVYGELKGILWAYKELEDWIEPETSLHVDKIAEVEEIIKKIEEVLK